MRGQLTENVHDIEREMSFVLCDIAERDAAIYGGYIPSTIFSDLCDDARSMASHDVMSHKFLWHIHEAGTYLHWLDIEQIANEKAYMDWRHNFLTWQDWTFDELSHYWGGKNNPSDRIFYFDGTHFREVSRDTTLLIWRYAGLELIHRHEDCQIEVTA